MGDMELNFFLTLKEPYSSALVFIQGFFQKEMQLQMAWKFNTPFYYYKTKWFAFLSYYPKTHEIYIAFVKGSKVNHPKLLSEGRKQQKIYRIDPSKDIDVKELTEIVEMLKMQY